MSNQDHDFDPSDQSKAGAIRAAAPEIAGWRDAGISVAAIARRLSERSGHAITPQDVYRETYRLRRGRKKMGRAATPGPGPVDAPASSPTAGAASELARRVKEGAAPRIEFDPKPDANDLI